MSEAPFLSRGRHSVFVKLVAIMLAMAAGQLAMVTLFFGLFVSPTLNTSMLRLIEEYAQVVAASAPDLAAARRMAGRAQVGIRYEGPEGAWATSEEVPPIGRGAGAGGVRRIEVFPTRASYEVRGARGGAYLVSWNIGRHVYAAHAALGALLLVLMTALIVVTHLVLNRLLRPLRTLGDGVARLGAGELDVVLPRETSDEFGVLTGAFNEMVKRVREMVSARDQLLLDVSHELRSPLTRVKVALEMTPPGENRERMTVDVAEMEAMIAELLELERLRDGRGARATRQDLLPILEEVLRGVAGREPGVTLVASASVVPATVDADQIRTVFRNLLDNALKYSLADSAPVRVEVRPDGDTIRVVVRDDGPGIPEADIGNVFEPFFRVDRSRSKKTGGYGLGLSICRRIVEAHGGTLTVRNVAPRGVEFTAHLH